MLVVGPTVRTMLPNSGLETSPTGLIEVGMVEQVEGLGADLQLRALAVRDAKVLHQAHVGIEEHRAIDLEKAS